MRLNGLSKDGCISKHTGAKARGGNRESKCKGIEKKREQKSCFQASKSKCIPKPAQSTTDGRKKVKKKKRR